MNSKSRPSPQPAGHEPLSRRLAGALGGLSTGPLTLNDLLRCTASSGVYLLIILLCLPFVIPVSIPGLSSVMGAIVAVLALRAAAGRPPSLPGFLGERPLPAKLRGFLLVRGVRFLEFLERFVRPRQSRWLAWPAVRLFNCACLALLAVLLALPLPAPPFFLTNSIPSYAIILLAAAMMEEDGVLLWFGYLAVALNLIFFSLIGGAIWQVLLKLWESFSHALAS